MSGYTEEENKKFNEFVKNTLLNKKTKKFKKSKRKRGLKKGEWKGGEKSE